MTAIMSYSCKGFLVFTRLACSSLALRPGMFFVGVRPPMLFGVLSLIFLSSSRKRASLPRMIFRASLPWMSLRASLPRASEPHFLPEAALRPGTIFADIASCIL